MGHLTYAYTCINNSVTNFTHQYTQKRMHQRKRSLKAPKLLCEEEDHIHFPASYVHAQRYIGENSNLTQRSPIMPFQPFSIPKVDLPYSSFSSNMAIRKWAIKLRAFFE